MTPGDLFAIIPAIPFIKEVHLSNKSAYGNVTE